MNALKIFLEPENYLEAVNDLIQKVCDDESRAKLVDHLKWLKAIDATMKEKYEKLKNPVHAAHKNICDEENRDRNPVQEAQKIGAAFLAVHDNERKQKADAEQRRLIVEQTKKAEEAKASAIAEAQKNGQQTLVEVLENMPTVVTVPKVQDKPKDGVSSGTEWILDGEIEKAEFLKQLASTPEPFFSQIAGAIEFKDGEIKKLLNSWKKTNPFPGIKATEVPKVTIRYK